MQATLTHQHNSVIPLHLLIDCRIQCLTDGHLNGAHSEVGRRGTKPPRGGNQPQHTRQTVPRWQHSWIGTA